ncbi:MAG: AAA family ATPase [Lachnospiraceae bacterium]|nr:AAA family ATPase [Lachnospiraceae bacterium]
MEYGYNWSEQTIPGELKEMLGDRIEGYYKWKLKTYGTGYAHIFFSRIDNTKELKENWEKIVDNIAVHVQSEVPDMLERSNFYIWFFVAGEVEKDLVKEIEDDTYSSRKFVISVQHTLSIEEKLELVRKKLFAFAFVVPESNNPMVTKVELYNFRAYKGKRIFDFNQEENIARLIVLFAPNGMGKTSFFDGIEWALSGTVSRFAEIADKNISGTPVLKNTEAESESAYVKIYQQNGEWVKRKVSKINDHTQRDYGAGRAECSKENPLKKYLSDEKIQVWGNLILPHHRIDGFIAGMKPTALYKEWGSLWDADGEKRRQFEEAYSRKRKEGGQYEDTKKRFKELQQQYEELEKGRNFVERLERDVEHFREISGNAVIERLNFSTISASEYVQWSSLVDSQFDLYEKRAKAVDKSCKYLDQEIEHDIGAYCTLLAEKKKNFCEQKKLQDYLGKCRNKSLLLSQKKELEKELRKHEDEMKEIRVLYERGERWYEEAVQYFGADRKLDELKKQLEDLERRIFVLQADGDKLNIEVGKKEKERREENDYKLVCEHARALAELREKQETLVMQKKDYEKQITDLQGQISKIKKTLERLENNKIRDFEGAAERCRKGIATIEEETMPQHIQQKLLSLIKTYQGLKENLSRITQQILAEEQVEERVKKILADSRKVIEEQKLSICPVCNTEFDSYQELLQHTYKIVSEEGAERKKEKQGLENEMLKVRQQAENLIDECSSYQNKLAEELGAKIEKLCGELQEKKKQNEEIEESVSALIKGMSEIQHQDQEKGIYVVYQDDGIGNWRSLWNAKLDKEIAELKTDIQKNKEQKTAYQEQLVICRRALEEAKDLILRMEAQPSESYTMMKDAEVFIKSQAYSGLKEWIENQTAQNEKRKKQLEECNERLETLQDISVSLEPDYEKQDMQVQSKIEKVEKDLLSIKKRMEEISIADMPDRAEDVAGYFKGIIEEKRQSFLKEKENIGMCIEALGKLKYNREVENYFLRWKEASDLLKEAEEAEKAGKKNLEEAEENYLHQKRKVEKEMEEFLQKYRMGEIYEKLEPHEKLKHLIAEFSFDEKGQPGLSFGVTGEKGDIYPPAWFLSTAQLNVVAFAIFLGRALQKEDVPLKSIFIDDPIGHFDEMNIVGFVDLLRNILENTDRQLIISTHEERVFGLIKRKMPQESYPVCYIDFREMA